MRIFEPDYWTFSRGILKNTHKLITESARDLKIQTSIDYTVYMEPPYR